MESLKKSGTFSELSCPRLLARLHRSRFGGTVRISRGALLKLLYFQAGEIAMASSNDQSDHLAPILIRAGKLKSEQLELARKQARPGTSLARVLVQMGFLTSGELFAGARQQLRQIVGSILTMPDAAYELQADYFPREITSLNVETRELLLDLVRDLADRSFVLLEVGAPDSVYGPGATFAEDSARLPRAWKEIADRFTGPLTIHEVGQLASLDDFSASKSVYALHLIGLLDPARIEEPAPVSIPISIVADRPMEPAAPAGAAEAAEEEPTVVVTEEAVSADEEEKESRVAAESFEVASRAAPEPAPAWAEERKEAVGAAAGPAVLSFPTRPETPPPGDEFKPIEPAREGTAVPGPVDKPASSPFRMEFRGPITTAPAPARRSSPWTALSILSGMAILAFALYWFVFLKPPAGPAPAAGSTASTVPEETPAASPPAEEAPAPAMEGPVAGEAGGPSDADRGASAGAGEAPTAPVPAPASEGGGGGASSVGKIPDEKKTPPEPTAPPPSAGSPISNFAAARSRLDAGEFPDAAGAWAAWINLLPSPGFTLQLAIACREESIRKAAERTGGSDKFFIVPFSMNGKPCYRLCWGTYGTLEAAQSARAGVPASFLSEGAAPVVVSFARLVPAEKP